MSQGYELKFPLPGPILNLNDRLHWAQKAKRVEAWRDRAYYAALQVIPKANRPLRWGPSTVRVDLPCNIKDASNGFATVKALVDGLTMAALWADDDTETVDQLAPRIVKPGQLVVVRIGPRSHALG